MKSNPREFSALIKCWQSLPRKEEEAPRKADFTPTMIPRLLPNIYLVEWSGKHTVSVRLIGSELETVFGAGIRAGKIFNTRLSDEWRYYDKIHRECAENLCAGIMSRTLTGRDGLSMDVDILCVPLADNNGTPKFMLGVMVVRRNRDYSIQVAQGDTPRNQIMKQKYIDLGAGIPDRLPSPPVVGSVSLYCH